MSTILEALKALPTPGQHYEEWKHFLFFLRGYFEEMKIDRPLVVEIGIKKMKQKPFYETILGADYVGVDYNNVRYVKPDVCGDSQLETTRDFLLIALGLRVGRGDCDLVFIDANHKYPFVKRDYELYAPLSKHLVALHDIHLAGPKQLWEELQAEAPKDITFISFYNPSPTVMFPGSRVEMGIGLIVKGFADGV